MYQKGLNILALAIIICFCNNSKLTGQNNKGEKKVTYTIGGNAFKGFILMHDKSIGHLIKDHPTGFEIFINKNTYGNEVWQQRFNNPDIGFSFGYFDLKNPTIGKILAATTYFDLYFLRKKRSAILFKIGTGIGYGTNPYDHENNNKNNAIGSRITFTMQGRLGYNFKINEKWKLTSAITLSHFSNGAFKLPNAGINIITSNFGVTYLLDQKPLSIVSASDDSHTDKRFHYNLSLLAGIKEVIPVNGKKFPFFNFQFYVDKKLNHISAINIGTDIFYSFAVKEEVAKDRLLQIDEKRPDFKRAGLTFGHELFVNKLSMLTQFGVYVYRPYKRSGQPVYQRFGLKYYFNDKYYAAFLLKTHYGVADNIEWGVGIRL